LPDGAWTDDDTDIEWPYILEIERTNNLLIPPQRISAIWREHVNRRIWCSHLFLRQIMDLGIDPPLTGRAEMNPWADFNLSGQFVSESWGLISPGMPQTAARIGIHYTHVSVEGEPVQSTQMIDSMIATAFLTSDTETILDAGAAALDPHSVMSRIMTDVRRWHKENPRDWRMSRKLTKDKYCRYGGHDMRDRNGVWLNGASTIAALLYGGGDFVETVRSAFNFGWDADNNAAAAGAILGVIKGNKWMAAQGWNVKDLYRNTSRDKMPNDETLTSFGGRLMALAERNITERGGGKTTVKGRSVYRIPLERPANVEALPDPSTQYAELRNRLRGDVENGIAAGTSAQEAARAAYLAICLDFVSELMRSYPERWSKAVAALNGYPTILQVIFYESPIPAGRKLAEKAIAAGLRKPDTSVQIWT
jgi:hypothetical protein